MKQLHVLAMVPVHHQTLVFVIVNMLEIIVNSQFALVYLQMIHQLALITELVIRQILVVVQQLIVGQIVSIQYVLV